MPQPLADDSLVLIDAPLDKAGAPLQRQLHDRLKQAILAGRVTPGSRLPGSRVLSDALSISRNTVTAVYELLVAEGYVQSDRQGTRVAALSRPPLRVGRDEPAAPGVASRLSNIRTMVSRGHTTAALRPGVPALAQFPLATWRRAVDRAIQQAGPAGLGYGDPFGAPALRAAIARHLGLSRGVRCTPAQVVITEGAQEAVALCARMLTNPGDTAWIEEPGYRGAKAAMHAADLHIVPKRVDAEGLATGDADWAARPPRLIYTTPSHQYPAGAVLSVPRRLALIAKARQHGAWIIEDDYDSEFRHAGESIAAMQGLVDHAPVLYLGTFSKTMFPSLRVGFMVVPEVLLAPLSPPLKELLRGGHLHEQLALAAFIDSGEFGRHLGRMRRLYRDRQRGLRDALTRHFKVPHTLEGGHSGMHLTVRLAPRFPDTAIVEAAGRYGISPVALSGFALRPLPEDNGLVLGYGNTPVELYEPLVKRLSQLVRAAETPAHKTGP
ncbi:PLP-dependent aminotransferase family protein [Rhizobacter sp. Root1221]|uniref:MocR-like pyridoxine biosynthesis transcription factor PdxR n=1 Tax=Rhizobacter sp. Root1221 TaxID=1736433 RepID=UPI0006FD6BF2|nr:PLP-dependent aminotransferase family protein [Rhizobacter sp. Root1221]KQV96888.1 DNA-binding protein [Rhizobacter sp. Root1221]